MVAKAVEAFLACGRYEGGFARLRCSTCAREHLLAFSCQTRNFCPSCQAKRAALLGERLVEEVLQPVAHRHIVFTIPKALRGLFERKRRLLGILARSAFDATRACLREQVGERAASALPGMVSSIQTFGSSLNWQPHIHALASDGLFLPGGVFLPVATWPTEEIEQCFRRLVLRRLVAASWLSEEFRERLLSWEHSGFSVHVGKPVSAEDAAALERLGRYGARAPVSMERVFLERDGRVKYLTPPDPRSGATHVHFDPLDWIHALVRQIPEPRMHMTRYQGAYANRVRRLYRAAPEPKAPSGEDVQGGEAGGEGTGACSSDALTSDLSEREKRRRASWARMIRRIYEVDPLACGCGGELKIVSVILDPAVIDRILAHREKKGMGGQAARAPPGGGEGL